MLKIDNDNSKYSKTDKLKETKIRNKTTKTKGQLAR